MRRSRAHNRVPCMARGYNLSCRSQSTRLRGGGGSQSAGNPLPLPFTLLYVPRAVRVQTIELCVVACPFPTRRRERAKKLVALARVAGSE